MSIEQTQEVATALACDVVENVSNFGFAGGPDTLVMALGIASGLPGMYLHNIISRYQERAVRGIITEDDGIDVALHNVRYMVAASAFLLAQLSEAHTLMSLELDRLIKTMPSKKQALMLLDADRAMLTEDATNSAHEATKNIFTNAPPKQRVS